MLGVGEQLAVDLDAMICTASVLLWHAPVAAVDVPTQGCPSSRCWLTGLAPTEEKAVWLDGSLFLCMTHCFCGQDCLALKRWHPAVVSLRVPRM